jgi:hypothetical protein
VGTFLKEQAAAVERGELSPEMAAAMAIGVTALVAKLTPKSTRATIVSKVIAATKVVFDAAESKSEAHADEVLAKLVLNAPSGTWATVLENASSRAQAYQQLVTGKPFGSVYIFNDVKFDGMIDDVLLEAKGPGYAAFFNADGLPKNWFGKGADDLIAQMGAQVRAAKGAPIRWEIAEPGALLGMQELAKKVDGGNLITFILKEPQH